MGADAIATLAAEAALPAGPLRHPGPVAAACGFRRGVLTTATLLPRTWAVRRGVTTWRPRQCWRRGPLGADWGGVAGVQEGVLLLWLL